MASIPEPLRSRLISLLATIAFLESLLLFIIPFHRYLLRRWVVIGTFVMLGAGAWALVIAQRKSSGRRDG